MLRYLMVLLFANVCVGSFAQDNSAIRLTYPTKEKNIVSSPKQFIVGNTCKNCFVTINDSVVKVYPNTGSFGFVQMLDTGTTTFNIVSSNPQGKQTEKLVSFTYAKPKPVQVINSPEIASIETFPNGDLVLMPGDKISFKVKALPGSTITTIGNTTLFEMPAAQAGVAGIYQGEYIVKANDNFNSQKFTITMQTKTGQTISKQTPNSFSVLSNLASNVVVTKGRLAFLEYGLGEDRLGGAKIGYLDEKIPLKIIGKVEGDYKVSLAQNRTAYIGENLVELAPNGAFSGYSLTGNCTIKGDEKYDYVTLALSTKLPYQSQQFTNPSKIVVDVFGAVNNTNWISQLETAKEIKSVDYEQVADDIFRLTILLNHRQHWGHKIYYNDNNLVIRVKQQPKNLSLKNLVVAIDAGHGGSNPGATGPSGAVEKNIALSISQKVKKILQQEGAVVPMTREKEMYVENKDRILIYRDNEPDLLVSIHLNSALDPINAGGTSTMYKHIGFKPLSNLIYKRMLELGLKEYGNIGQFNFMLNSPTEYPNALVETLFLSNVAEENLVVTDEFQQKIAEKIVLGIKDFLKAAKDEE